MFIGEATGHLPDSQLSAMQCEIEQLLTEPVNGSRRSLMTGGAPWRGGWQRCLSSVRLTAHGFPRGLPRAPCWSPTYPQILSRAPRLSSRRQR